MAMNSDEFSTSTPLKTSNKSIGNENEFQSTIGSEIEDLRERIQINEINQQKSISSMNEKYEQLQIANMKLQQRLCEIMDELNNQKLLFRTVKATEDRCIHVENQIRRLNDTINRKPTTEGQEEMLTKVIKKSFNVLKSHFDTKIDLLIHEVSCLNIKPNLDDFELTSENESTMSKETPIKDTSDTNSFTFEKPKLISTASISTSGNHNLTNNRSSNYQINETNTKSNNVASENQLGSASTNINFENTAKPMISLAGSMVSNNGFPSINKSQSQTSVVSNTKPVQTQPISTGLFGNMNKPLFSSTSLHPANLFGSNHSMVKDTKPSFSVNYDQKSVFGSSFLNNNEPKQHLFSNMVVTKQDGDSKSNTTDFGFGSASEVKWDSGGKLFGNNTTNEGNVEKDDTANVEEECGAHFDPIVELPPLIEQQKDDETSEVLFKSRCKLFRFVENEWKERGLGEMKILKPKDASSNLPLRLLMRREQVGKICCNHSITKLVPALKKMNEKSYCWFAKDFSDNEPKNEQFAIRFGKEILMDEFKKTIEDLQKQMKE